MNINVGSVCIDNGKQQYYLCKGTPIYDKPSHQIQLRYNYIHMRYSSRADSKIGIRLDLFYDNKNDAAVISQQNLLQQDPANSNDENIP